MLERTAASLESSSLHRAVVLGRGSRQQRRRLGVLHGGHTRQRGTETAAPAVKTLDAPDCAAREHGSVAEKVAVSTRPPGRAPPVLDFLYPRPTHALLHRPSCPLVRPRDTFRAFESVCQSRRQASSRPGNRFRTTAPADEKSPAPERGSGKDSVLKQSDVPGEAETKSDPGKDSHPPADAVHIANTDVRDHSIKARKDSYAKLEDILSGENRSQYHDAWDFFRQLSQDRQDSIRTRVVAYLSTSRSLVETGRAMSLFRQTPIEQWDDDFLSAAVLLILRSEDRKSALKVFKTGQQKMGLIGGAEYLLIDFVREQQWSTALDIWLTTYVHMEQNPQPNATPQGFLGSLANIPELAKLYFSLERYLAKDDGINENRLDRTMVSKKALALLRQTLAHQSLRQRCPPPDAAKILKFWRSADLYEEYLTQMFSLWYTKQVSDDFAVMLYPVYEDYRKLPGSKPSHAVLRGVFKVLYPDRLKALAQLRDDWIRDWGELSHWGFEKFLKLYAKKGKVKTVRELWDRYVQLFPSRLKTPRGFRSTINAYASAGDLPGIEAELDRMVSLGVEPDIDTWNMVLKCYTRASVYHRVLAVFEEIRNVSQPDSYTYAHVLSMCAGKGDLDAVVDYFSEAQKDGVPVTKEMAQALVTAYCQNDLLDRAQGIAIELARRGITSVAIFNKLLHHNSIQGRLAQCYRLLDLMKQYKLSWNAETVAFLLQALVRNRRVIPAMKLLQNLLVDKHHLIQTEHFAIVMLGALRIDDRSVPEALMKMMWRHNIPVPFNVRVAYAHAVKTKAPHALRAVTLGREILRSMSNLVEDNRQDKSDPRALRQRTSAFALAIQFLVDLRDFTSSEELLRLYHELFPRESLDGKHPRDEPMRSDVIAALMMAYHADEQYDGVHSLWQEMWPKILRRGTMPNGEAIFPKHQYDVNRPIFRLTQTFRAQEDGQGLLNVVTDVVKAGFKFTSHTWDHIIRCLADLGQWEAGMEWCEKLLMPRWQGWGETWQLPKENQDRSHPRVLKPTREAVLALQREWLETRKLAAWSGQVSRKLEKMETQYPLLHDAFLASSAIDISGPWIVRDDVDIEKAIHELLKGLPLKELQDMERALVSQLSRQPAEERESLFRRKTSASHSGPDVALQREELMQLRSVLQQRLPSRTPDAEEVKDPFILHDRSGSTTGLQSEDQSLPGPLDTGSLEQSADTSFESVRVLRRAS